MGVESKVMVTGATGYVAGWLVKTLLEEGYTVHAAVREPHNEEKIKYLKAMGENSRGEIIFFKADLLEQGSYTAAMQGCEVVYHTASPFSLRVDDPQRDLVAPAVKGTQNVLRSVEETRSVKRVVLTSSVAAIYGDNIDARFAREGRLREEDWNQSSSLKHQPYSYSKTLAERAAWEMVEGQDRWQLVVINPSLVFGPGINPHASSESFTLLRELADGTMKAGVPDYAIAAVDVREVARAHLAAATHPEAEGRFIISGHESSFKAIAELLEESFPGYAFPRRVLPKWLVWLVGPMVNDAMTRPLVTKNVGHTLLLDNRKSRDLLGIEYRPLKDSLVEMFQQLVDHDLVSKS